MQSRVAVLAFVVLLLGSCPAAVGALEPARPIDGTVAADSSGGSGESLPSVGTNSEAVATSHAEDVLSRTTVLRHRPADPDVFEATLTVGVPDSVTELEIELERGATVESMAGFERTGERTFRWTEDREEATIRYTMPADRRGEGERGGARSASDGYAFVDTGDWGVVAVPDVGLSLRRTEPVGLEKTVRVDGSGATGGDIAFFGSVREYERAVDGGTIRLVVPDAATLRESPDAILTSLADARERLEVGARNDEVFVVAVPHEVDWGSRGIQYGQSDAWVVDDATLDDPNPVWLHEYVHTRQRFSGPETGIEPEAEWIVEGQADYYAGLLALENGRTEFDEFKRLLERGEQSPDADGTLVDRSTWGDERTHYVKGALVYGEIDRRLRLETDGDRTLADVFRSLNAHEEAVTEAQFLAAIEDAGGVTVRAVAERYTRTNASPEMWTRSQHAAAFDQPVAVFEYGLGPGSLEVADGAWERELPLASADTDSEERDAIAIPVGESVTIPGRVSNVGEREGVYDATLQVDGRVVDHYSGRLTPGAETSHRFSWTPSEPGEYEVRVGSERLPVVVRSSASVTVTDLRVTPDSTDPGEPVTATATVEAADDRPAAAILAFKTVDGVVAERPVAIRPGETATVDADLRFDEDGRYEIAVGERTATVSVGGPLTTLEEMPGFGLSAALAAVGIVCVRLVLARRR
ncbi:CARDB domain-containing protein [Natrinema longum]|uniref:CARDB domain-containing protein n=1 Tax=Natrinema longum TaxID=370324 RepID=A0A8A2U5Y1_9EURY|nr:CARDB domain-containing protein [Natrinema longum]MBZ6494979.1 hypothetical protein [Natrinema longum]QSW83725.1 hypothetical protein J0X27_09540 [Natrinema longum]